MLFVYFNYAFGSFITIHITTFYLYFDQKSMIYLFFFIHLILFTIDITYNYKFSLF